VEKPEEDVSKSSNNIETEEAMFAAVHKLFNMRIGRTLPPRLTARSRRKVVVFYLYKLGLHYTSSPCCLRCADNCILLHSNCILLLQQTVFAIIVMIISVLISMFDLSPISDMPLLFCPQDNLLRSKMSSGHFTSK